MRKRLWNVLGSVAVMLLMVLFVPGNVKAAEMVDGRVIAPFAGAMVTSAKCNVRSGPTTGYAVLGKMDAGQVVNACGVTDNGWFQVVYGTGIGYIKGNLMVQVPVDQNMLTALAQQAAFVKQSIAVKQSTMQTGGISATAAPQTAVPQAAVPVVPGSGNLIFVGDSRTGMMGNAVGGTAAWPGTAFVACYGGGVDWLSTEAAKREIDAFVIPGSIIIINYGVNDLDRHGDYIKLINKYSQEWISKGAAVYFASVGEVNENQYGKTNWAVQHFNTQLFNHLNWNIGRIDLYGYLAASGYQMEADGLHYCPETSARMFAFLKGSVGR